MSVLQEKIGRSNASLDKFAAWIVRLLEAFAAGLMAAIAILVFVNATGRYAFSRPLPWTEEVVLTSMVWIAGVGVVLASFRGTIMSCDIIAARLEGRWGKSVGIFVAVLGAAVMAAFAYATWEFIMLFGRDLTPLLRMPKSIAMYGSLFAFAGLALVMAVRVIKLVRN